MTLLSPQIFEGYRKNLRARQNKLPVPFRARLVRIRPLLSRQYEIPCVRLEIYGCSMANSGKRSTYFLITGQ